MSAPTSVAGVARVLASFGGSGDDLVQSVVPDPACGALALISRGDGGDDVFHVSGDGASLAFRVPTRNDLLVGWAWREHPSFVVPAPGAEVLVSRLVDVYAGVNDLIERRTSAGDFVAQYDCSNADCVGTAIGVHEDGGVLMYVRGDVSSIAGVMESDGTRRFLAPSQGLVQEVDDAALMPDGGVALTISNYPSPLPASFQLDGVDIANGDRRVFRLDRDGHVLWSRLLASRFTVDELGFSSFDWSMASVQLAPGEPAKRLFRVVPGRDGVFVVVNRWPGAEVEFVAALDDDGEERWNRRVDPAFALRSARPDGEGGVALLGVADSRCNLPSVVMLSPEGEVTLSQVLPLPCSDSQVWYDVDVVWPGGTMLVRATFSGALTVGSRTFESDGWDSAFLAVETTNRAP